jgi:hypothetical protein
MANADHSPTPSSAAPHEGGPVWLTLAYRYGFPAAVAAFLIYFLTQVVDTKVDAIARSQQETQSAITELLKESRANQERESKQLWAVCMTIADGDPISERWCKVGLE